MAFPERALSWLRSHEGWLAPILLAGLAAGYAARFVDFRGPPFEDAAMLMRYAEHLSRGFGVVWNVGEPPVDGATDFLFMVNVAALIKAGLSTGRAVRGLGLAAHLLTVLLVYWVNRRLWKAGATLSLLTGLYLAVGTGAWYVAAYFGTTYFALFAALTWALALVLMETRHPPQWVNWAFACSGLIAGLVRPEGVLLAALMLLAILLMRGWRASRQVLIAFGVTMVIAGGAYFAWHWLYFGHPLPNPYYKKGAGILHLDSLWESFGYLLRFAGPFSLALVLGLRSKALVRRTAAMTLPLVGFAALFALISNETNFGGRFQYALWPIILMSFYPLVRGLGTELGFDRKTVVRQRRGWAWTLAAAILAYGILRYGADQACHLTAQQRSCGIAYEADGRYAVARQLSEYRGKGYVIATSEAGLLPLYSGWTAVDTWGLNDVWIARNGQITAEYLQARDPHVIVFHAYFSPLVPARRSSKDLENAWHKMTLTLDDYARSHDYVLAAAFGDSPYEAHYYYVREDFADADKIARDISRLRDYYWYATGKKALNYADLPAAQE